MVKKLNKFLILWAVVAAVAVSPAWGNLVVNGGFEDPVVGLNNWALLPSISGWSILEGSPGSNFEIQSFVTGAPYEGNQHIELDGGITPDDTVEGGRNLYIIQFVPTTIGQSYTLQFAFSARPNMPPGVEDLQTMAILFGESFFEVSADATGLTDTNWTLYSFTIQATGEITPVAFIPTSADNGLGAFLDGVVVEQVPEPATFGLLGAGAFFMAFALRRARR